MDYYKFITQIAKNKNEFFCLSDTDARELYKTKKQLFPCQQAEVIAAAKNLLGTNSGEILVGNEESEYWDKIQSDRQDKVSGKIKVQPTSKKERGKDKIVKKYENAVRNTHKFFDDGE